MYIKEVSCPTCAAKVIVDGALWEIGSVRLRCPSGAHMFLPAGSPHTQTVESVANASVPVVIWDPEARDEV